MTKSNFNINPDKFKKIHQDIETVKDFSSMIENQQLRIFILNRLYRIQKELTSCWDKETIEIIKNQLDEENS